MSQHHIELVANREEIVANREEIVANREEIVANREEIVANCEEIVANREEIVANREEIVANGEEIVANREEIVANGEETEDITNEVNLKYIVNHSKRSATSMCFIYDGTQFSDTRDFGYGSLTHASFLWCIMSWFANRERHNNIVNIENVLFVLEDDNGNLTKSYYNVSIVCNFKRITGNDGIIKLQFYFKIYHHNPETNADEIFAESTIKNIKEREFPEYYEFDEELINPSNNTYNYKINQTFEQFLKESNADEYGFYDDDVDSLRSMKFRE
jgi:hypothetical protein